MLIIFGKHLHVAFFMVAFVISFHGDYVGWQGVSMWPFTASWNSARSCFVPLCFIDFHPRSASRHVTVPWSLLLQLFTNLEAFECFLVCLYPF